MKFIYIVCRNEFSEFFFFFYSITNIKLLNDLILSLKQYFIIFHFPVLNFLFEIKMQMYIYINYTLT